MTATLCPLCNGSSRDFYRFGIKHFHCCDVCGGIFMDPSRLPSDEQEQKRYLEHNNDVYDKGYRRFVSPVTTYVKQTFDVGSRGLDYGAGAAPVVTAILREEGFTDISLWDPLFHPDSAVLDRQYDFIICCETMEHFHFPDREFRRMHSLLRPGGSLCCMTDLWRDGDDFHRWYYKDDQTHVFIYRRDTLFWIRENMGFSSITTDGRRIVFRR